MTSCHYWLCASQYECAGCQDRLARAGLVRLGDRDLGEGLRRPNLGGQILEADAGLASTSRSTGTLERRISGSPSCAP